MVLLNGKSHMKKMMNAMLISLGWKYFNEELSFEYVSQRKSENVLMNYSMEDTISQTFTSVVMSCKSSYFPIL